MSDYALKTRVNGFQCPPSRDQIKTLLVYPVITVCYYLLVYVTLLDNTDLLITLVVANGILTVLLSIAWVTVEYIDPELKPGRTGIPVICFQAPEKSARFCGACRKTVAGLDHHCTWLNTCVGRRNYVSFISLVFIGAVQSVLQTAVGVISLSVWVKDDLPYGRITSVFGGKVWGFYVVVSLYTMMAGLMALGLLVLAAFHTYLMVVMRMGTYDWLLHRRSSMYDASVHDDDRESELSNKERKRQKEREEWQRIISVSRKKKCLENQEGSNRIAVDANIYNKDGKISAKEDSYRISPLKKIVSSRHKPSHDIEAGLVCADCGESPAVKLANMRRHSNSKRDRGTDRSADNSAYIGSSSRSLHADKLAKTTDSDITDTFVVCSSCNDINLETEVDFEIATTHVTETDPDITVEPDLFLQVQRSHYAIELEADEV